MKGYLGIVVALIAGAFVGYGVGELIGTEPPSRGGSAQDLREVADCELECPACESCLAVAELESAVVDAGVGGHGGVDVEGGSVGGGVGVGEVVRVGVTDGVQVAGSGVVDKTERGECVCPAPVKCRECPPAERVCLSEREALARLGDELKELRELKEGARRGSYEGATSAERRYQAAQDENMYLDFPAWTDELTMPEKAYEESGLTPEERLELERLYREFTLALAGRLRELLVELTGNPSAGADSTMNALLHNVLQLSPQAHCRERSMVYMQAILAGQPVPVPGVDAVACEVAVYTVFTLVDELEAEVARRFGERGLKALWSGTSSFTFSVQGVPGGMAP